MGIVFRKVFANPIFLCRASRRSGLRFVAVQDEIKSILISLLVVERIGRGDRRYGRIQGLSRVRDWYLKGVIGTVLFDCGIVTPPRECRPPSRW